MLLIWLLLSSIWALPQINFHSNDYCLRITITDRISFCFTELNSRNLTNSIDQKLTFNELKVKNITSEQLYQWSASIDLIEQYEEYLISNQSEASIFYNCTWPRFGSQCQYEFLYLPSENLTLNEIIRQFYEIEYKPTSLTCYTHLECDRGLESLCLDWADICDGSVHCLNDQIDEKYCWQMQINECNDDEYRCRNGQCISKRFFRDQEYMYECLDRSDAFRERELTKTDLSRLPTIHSEDISCSERSDMSYTFFTSSCDDHLRHELLSHLIINDRPITLPTTCYLAFYCTFYTEKFFTHICQDICEANKCIWIINETCPDIIIIPSVPIAFGHVYLGYFRKTDHYFYIAYPDLICFNKELCRFSKSNNYTSIMVDNKTCLSIKELFIDFPFRGRDIKTLQRHLDMIQKSFQICNTIISDDRHLCNSLHAYQCQNSTKCLSMNRLCDGIFDCYLGDDEDCRLINENCSPIESNFLFKCPMNGKCISLNRFGDQICDCPYNNAEQLCEDETSILCDPNNLNACHAFAKQHYIQNTILFPTICDNFQELLPILINNETYYSDETECDYWQCNNTYTRCNRFWNCLDGADEIGCDEYPIINCPLNHHVCVKRQTFEFICLSLDKVNDGEIDCLGAIDEPSRCHRLTGYKWNVDSFYCDFENNEHCVRPSMICQTNCIDQNSSLFCQNDRWFCSSTSQLNGSDFAKYFCLRPADHQKTELGYFSLNQTGIQPIINEERRPGPVFENQTFEYNFVCHRGYPLRLWHDQNRIVCLCPDSYYGDYCQYQNQRVSLTLQFQTYSDARQTLFSLVIQLIDNSSQRIVHSVKQFTYIYIKHCQTKFNFYLTYSTRPKQSNRTYSIHIDIYEKLKLDYRASLFIPLKFSFLPVHRISYVLTIPRNDPSTKMTIVNCPVDLQCVHGQCMTYAESLTDDNDSTFCRCHSGWHGKDCSIMYNCTCSSNEFCAGIETNGRSICICPLDRWGPRCYLRNTICQSSPCLNNGQCIITDEEFFCICSKGFSGDRCELEDTKIMVSFDRNIQLSETMLVHFIEVQHHAPVRNGSTFQSIPLYQNEITIHWSRPFHIVFTELSDKVYYLIDVQKDYNRTKTIRKLLTPLDRCGDFSEYLNETIVNDHLIRRIKYYHIPCQKQISCFYDRDHFCLCNDFGSQRIANCFEFNSSLAQNCFQLSSCQNDGQCLQDDVHCPKTFRCVCRECFYGSLCQFSSSLFDLSLDGIIGSHILPHRSLLFQPLIIRTSLSLIVLMVAIGFINSILSVLAFQSKETRQVGCGYYLLGSTITTFFTSIMLVLKFSILLSAQMSIVTNRTFLNIQCYSLDYLLQVFLNLDRWLNGCIAIERAFNIIKGTKFNKKQSKQMAKYIITLLIIMTSSSTVYNVIHRRLVDDDSNDEYKRIWCIVSYPSQLSYFNQIVHMFHFLIPFLMNIISAVIIIFLATKRRQAVQHDQTYYEIFVEQIQQHRHLLIAPFILIVLSLPRLIISFVAGCIQSKRNSWIYLIGYLISFIPPMLTFVIFVSPSKLYKQEFRKTLKHYRKRISCFQFQ